jgi:aspartate dehydrogenase
MVERHYKLMRLGLIGCGSIGSAVANAIAKGSLSGIELVGATDAAGIDRAAKLAAIAGCPFFADVPALLDVKPDLVLEAASAEAVRSYAARILECGADLMMVSVGALVDTEFREQLTDQVKRLGRRIYVPSGAIGGLDIIRAAVFGDLEECTLTTTKPPRALAGAPYVIERDIDLEAIREAKVIFEGSAKEAARFFPQNLNVAAAISLAGFGLDKTTVRIIADPAATRNIHEVFVRGAFGEATVRLVNQPSPDNPKSSSLTSLSVIATLQRINQQFQLGT